MLRIASEVTEVGSNVLLEGKVYLVLLVVLVGMCDVVFIYKWSLQSFEGNEM